MSSRGSCMHVSLFVQNHFHLLSATGRRPPGDASVCHPDRSAVWTPGGPGPDQGGLSQCLCRTARYLGKAGARVLLGACQLGAEPDLKPVCILQKNFTTHPPKILHWSSPHELIPLFPPPKKKACWHSLGVCWTPPPPCDWCRVGQLAVNWGTTGRGWCQRNTLLPGRCSRSTALLARGRPKIPDLLSPPRVVCIQVWF